MSVTSSKMTETVAIKGTSDGLVITLGEGSFQTILSDLEKHLASRASFFWGGRAALRVGERPLSVEQLQTIGTIVQGIGMTLWAVEGMHPATEVAARELGLEVHQRPAASSAQAAAEPASLEEMVGIVVKRTLRSGQSIQHAGHITLIGDVNPGAEVVAGGDVIVWGKLRGTVHAGAMGDARAVVCALQLAPSQIRIAMHIARPPERGRPPKVPEIASVQDDRIVVERWDTNR